MLTIQECEKILNTSTKKYTQDEARQIRKFLYLLAGLEFENYKIQRDANRSDLYKGINRGTKSHRV